MDGNTDSDSDDEQQHIDLSEELEARIEAQKNRAQGASKASDPIAHCSWAEPNAPPSDVDPTAYLPAASTTVYTSSDEDQNDDDAWRQLEEFNAMLAAEDKLAKEKREQQKREQEEHELENGADVPVPIQGFHTAENLAAVIEAIEINENLTEKLNRLDRQCRERLEVIKPMLQSLKTEEEVAKKSKIKKQKEFQYVTCGKPYFRDKDNFPGPDNEDTILMRAAGMFDYSRITKVRQGWTAKDKHNFLQEMLIRSRNIRKDELQSRIAQLRREHKRAEKTKEKSAAYQKEIRIAYKEIEKIKKKPLKDVALPIDQEYDWDAIAITLKQRHSANEYESFWKLLLHPSVNSSSWTEKEHVSLLKIAQAHNYQDWNSIATELNTGRSSYQCFVYYRTHQRKTKPPQKWTKDEELYLKRIINSFRFNGENYIPWGKVAACVPGRTKAQVYNKYLRLTETRKGRFAPEEDGVILTISKSFGPCFMKMKKFLPGRSISQIRTRYHVLKNEKSSKSVVWTEEEDKKLIQIMANQDSSTKYSSLVEHFPGKTRVNIRARHVTLKKWMNKRPNSDISLAPRRGARRLRHGHAESDLNKALQKLKGRFIKEVEDKKCKEITKDSSESDIEEGIMALLITEKKRVEKKPKKKQDTPPSTSTNSADMENLLILLKAKLNKEKFQNSEYSKKYPELLNDKNSVSVVKTYSKKAPIQCVVQEDNQEDKPDIWGERPLKCVTHLLPPNYATITACKQIMDLALLKPKNRTLPPTNKNRVYKEQMDLFIERFITLFAWPLALANHTVDELRASVPPTTEKKKMCQPKMFHRMNFAKDFSTPLPTNIPKKDRVTDREKTIDLENNVREEDINIQDLNIIN